MSLMHNVQNWSNTLQVFEVSLTILELEEKLRNIFHSYYLRCKNNLKPFHPNVPFLSPRSSPPEVLLGKNVLKMCSKFTGEHPCRSVIPIKLRSNFATLLKSHFSASVLSCKFAATWNHTLAWLFSCKFAAYFQNIFF